MKKFISFSGGVESTTMCILYGSDAKAIWADTGAEHKVMYDRMEYVENSIKIIHPNFEIIKVKGFATHKGEKYEGLEDLAIAYKFMPSGQARYCTKFFKSYPIDNFLMEKGECELMIGFNFDEQGRTGSLEAQPNIKYTYPLIEDGLTRDDCEEILNKHNLHPNFPVYMGRGGCRMCFFKSEKEYRGMFHLNIDEFNEVRKFEETIQDKRKKLYSIMCNVKSLGQLAYECENEKHFMVNADWTDLYKSLKKETSCGAFCNR